MKKKSLLVMLAVFICLWGSFRYVAYKTIQPWSIGDDYHFHFIAHEGGGIDGRTYTNSKEALELSIKHGYKLFELDLNETTDRNLVAAHDWLSYRKNTGDKLDLDQAMSTADYVNKKIFNSYTPLTSNDIKKYFLENKDLYFITDKTNNFQLINSSFPFPDRLFVEVFGVVNYIKAVMYGIQRPMYAVGSLRLGAAFEYFKISLLGIKYVTVNTVTVKKCPDLFARLKEDGVKIFIYTSNDPEFIDMAIKKYNATIYTDFWDIQNKKCIGNNCTSY